MKNLSHALAALAAAAPLASAAEPVQRRRQLQDMSMPGEPTTLPSPCPFCPDGLGVDPSFELPTGDGTTCGVAYQFALTLTAVDPFCDTVLLAAPLCCPPEPEKPMIDLAALEEALGGGGEEPAAGTIVDIAVGNEAFSTLVAAVTAADLVDALSGEGPLTVFAPVNDAFAALPAGTVDALLLPENNDLLTSVLLYHVVAGSVLSTDLVSGDVPTLQGDTVAVVVGEDGVTVNSANVVTADIIASNGVIHVIDAVLLPPEPEEAPEMSMSMSMSMPEEPETLPTIVEIAASNEAFSTLVAAVSAAGLVDALSGEGPLTVFAPVNDAFAALPAGTVDALLLPENNALLTSVLLYHVVAGSVLSTDLVTGDVPTLEGNTVAVVVGADGSVTVNGANVVAADIMASNGVIHVIDAVLLPPEPAADGAAAKASKSKSSKSKSAKSEKMFKSGKSKSSKTVDAKAEKMEKQAKTLKDPKSSKVGHYGNDPMAKMAGKSTKGKSVKSEKTVDAKAVKQSISKSAKAKSAKSAKAGYVPKAEKAAAGATPETLPAPVPETLPEPVPENPIEPVPETLPEPVPETLPEGRSLRRGN